MSAIMPFTSAINSKLYEKTYYWLLILSLPSWQYTTVSMSMYERGKFISLVPRPRPVSITCNTLAYCTASNGKLGGAREWGYKFIVYKFPVQFTGIFCYLQVTSLQYSLQQIVVSYLQVTDQSVSYYTFSLLTVCFQPISELLHCLHVQEKHAATLFGLWC